MKSAWFFIGIYIKMKLKYEKFFWSKLLGKITQKSGNINNICWLMGRRKEIEWNWTIKGNSKELSFFILHGLKYRGTNFVIYKNHEEKLKIGTSLSKICRHKITNAHNNVWSWKIIFGEGDDFYRFCFLFAFSFFLSGFFFC